MIHSTTTQRELQFYFPIQFLCATMWILGKQQQNHIQHSDLGCKGLIFPIPTRHIAVHINIYIIRTSYVCFRT